MDFSVTAIHFELKTFFKDLITEKLSAALKIFPGTVTSAKVNISLDSSEYEIKAVISFKTHNTITATARNKDLRIAIDDLESKVAAQIRKLKEKISDHHKK